MVVDRGGIPLAVLTSAANVHDSRLFEYGGMKAKELEKENARLKRLVAEQALDNLI